MIGISRQAITRHLGVDSRAALPCVLVLLEDNDPRALSHHEAVAILVIGTRGFLRRVVESGGQRARRAEARHADATDRRLRAARNHDVGIA